MLVRQLSSRNGGEHGGKGWFALKVTMEANGNAEMATRHRHLLDAKKVGSAKQRGHSDRLADVGGLFL